MGFTGWSQGCDRCRKAHTRCDEAKPSCMRCTRRGLPCPGYRHSEGIIVKNQTNSILAKYGKKSSKKCIAAEVNSLVLPQMVRPDAQQVAIDFFFLNCVLNASKDWALSRGHFDHIAPLYMRATQDSALASAVRVLADQSISLHFGINNLDAYARNELLACKALQKAIADPVQRLQDETLLAVLAMDFANGVWSNISKTTISNAHIDGAMALVIARGEDNHRDGVSASLLAATRSVSLVRALWANSDHHTQLIKQIPPQRIGCNPTTDIFDMIAKALALELRLIKDSRALSEPARSLFNKKQVLQADELLDQLARWYEKLPPTWLPVVAALHTQQGTMLSDQFPKLAVMQIVYTIGQWYCLQVWVNKSLYMATDDQYVAAGASLEADIALKSLVMAIDHLQSQQQASGDIKVKTDNMRKGSARMDTTCRPAIAQENYAITLIQWALVVLTEDFEDMHGFDVGDESMQKLLSQAQVAKSGGAAVVEHASVYY